jgi:hypothetical protein
MCDKFYLFEPICTAILLASASGACANSTALYQLLISYAAIHVIRVHAIYEKSRPILFGLGALFALQVAVTAIGSGFYRCTHIHISLVKSVNLSYLSRST